MLINLILRTPLLGLLLGPLVTLLGDAVHRAWPWLDRQAPVVKQAFAVVLAFVLVGVSQLVPGAVPVECADTLANGLTAACEAALGSGAFLTSIVTALVSIAVKHGQKTGAAK